MADVEMKSAADSKPADDATKEEAKVEEPTDCFYGKSTLLSHSNPFHSDRTKEVPSASREGGQRERLQDLGPVNQIIQKAQEGLHAC